MKYRRTNPHPSLPTSPSHTHTYTNLISLDSWFISRDSTTPLGSLCAHRPCQGYTHNPTGLPVRSQGLHLQYHWAPCAFTGMYPHTNPLSRCPPTPFLPHPGFYVFILHILQETALPSVCAHQVRDSILWNFCHLVAYLCREVSLRQ